MYPGSKGVIPVIINSQQHDINQEILNAGFAERRYQPKSKTSPSVNNTNYQGNYRSQNQQQNQQNDSPVASDVSNETPPPQMPLFQPGQFTQPPPNLPPVTQPPPTLPPVSMPPPNLQQPPPPSWKSSAAVAVDSSSGMKAPQPGIPMSMNSIESSFITMPQMGQGEPAYAKPSPAAEDGMRGSIGTWEDHVNSPATPPLQQQQQQHVQLAQLQQLHPKQKSTQPVPPSMSQYSR